MALPPPQSGMTPQQYYMTLIGQGVRSQDAYAAVVQNFGPPKTPEEQAKERAGQQQTAGLIGTAGSVAGIVGGSYLGGLFGSGAAAAGGTAAGAGAAGAAGAAGTAGAAGGSAAGLGAAGAGGAGVAGASGTGAAGAGAGTTATGAGLGAFAAPLGIAALGALTLSNAYETGGKDILRGKGTREDWANQGVNMVTGFLPNTVLRFMGKRSIGKMMSSGKGGAQLERDQVRAGMKDAGILDDKYLGTLADGSKFDFGVDGKPLSWKEFDKRIVDTPSYNDTVALTDAMVTGMGLSGQNKSNVNLLFSRAAQSNAGDDYGIAKNNVLHFANQLGITSDVIKASTQKQFDENNISQSQYDTYMSLADQFPAGQSSSGLENAIPASSSAAVPIRPEEGNALRVSPGLYRIDTGEMIKAKSLRDALDQAYLQRPGKPLEPSQGK